MSAELLEGTTPGPWEAHQGIDEDQPTVWDVTSRHNHRDYGETPKGWFVATVHEVTDEANAEANARLIAKAPELAAENARMREALEKIEHVESAGLARHIAKSAIGDSQ